MNGSEFTALLRRAFTAAVKFREAQEALTEAFDTRYGADYGELPNDGGDTLVDTLDYGQGERAPTATEVDRLMTEAGYPPKVRAPAA